MASVAGTNDYSALDVRGESVVPENPRIESPQREERRWVNGAARSGTVRDDDAGTEVAPSDDSALRAAPPSTSTHNGATHNGADLTGATQNGAATQALNGHAPAEPVVLSPAVNGKPTRIDAGHALGGVAQSVAVEPAEASTEEATIELPGAPLATDEPAETLGPSEMLRAIPASGPATTRRIAVPWSLRWRWICQRWLPVAIVGTCALAALLIWQDQIQPLDAAGTPAPTNAIASPASDDHHLPSADDAVVHYGPSSAAGRR